MKINFWERQELNPGLLVEKQECSSVQCAPLNDKAQLCLNMLSSFFCHDLRIQIALLPPITWSPNGGKKSGFVFDADKKIEQSWAEWSSHLKQWPLLCRAKLANRSEDEQTHHIIYSAVEFKHPHSLLLQVTWPFSTNRDALNSRVE